MSPTKLNFLLTGALFAIIIAVSSSVVADDLRFFKPYSPESFGGGRRVNDGVYASLTGIYWSFSTPKGGYIGATNSKGDDETRQVYDINLKALRDQTNSLKIEMMGPTTTLGTRIEVGNRRGHHGWLFSGYNLPSQGHTLNVTNVTMAIREEGTFAVPDGQAVYRGGATADVGYLWGPNFGIEPRIDYISRGEAEGNTTQGWIQENGVWVFYRGPWESWYHPRDDERNIYVPEGQEYFSPGRIEEPDETATIAPLPVAFDAVSVNVHSHHRSGELMYTYRPHPFTWASMELLAGARYWDFEDGFGFNGSNVIIADDNGEIGTYGPNRAFENLVIDAKGSNCVVGPQIGIKLNRQNARWTFGAEGRFTAGINHQTVETSGYITPHRAYTPIGAQDASSSTGDLGNTYEPSIDEDGVPLWRRNDISFGHKETKSYFSPVLEGRLSADWQWTNAVSFFGAVNGMFVDNVARGVRVTDYVVKSDGTLFGIRGNDRNTHVFVYGVEAGVKINR